MYGTQVRKRCFSINIRLDSSTSLEIQLPMPSFLLAEMCDLTSAPELKPAPPSLSEQARKQGRTIKEDHVLMIGDDACMQVFEGAYVD